MFLLGGGRRGGLTEHKVQPVLQHEGFLLTDQEPPQRICGGFRKPSNRFAVESLVPDAEDALLGLTFLYTPVETSTLQQYCTSLF